MTRILIALFALIAALASPSFAADLSHPVYKAPPGMYVAPPFSWTGFYVGINGGYGWGRSNWSSVATAGTPKPNGGLLGGTVGYNLQTGIWVWGLEGDIDASWMKGSDGSGTGVCTGVGCQTKNTWLATTRARIGYAADRFLPYITGGAAFGDIKMTPAGGTSTTTTKGGWTVGGGVEFAIAAAWSAKLEYLYADLGKATCGAATCGIDTAVTYKANIVRAGVNYRF
jgi:outer membrane immunogenic protein